jgi:hypothetical protein
VGVTRSGGGRTESGAAGQHDGGEKSKASHFER